MTSEEAKVLLRNCGFKEDFLDNFRVENPIHLIKRQKIRKVASESAVILLPPEEVLKKRSFEEEDMAAYRDYEESEFYSREEDQGFGADTCYFRAEEVETQPPLLEQSIPDSGSLNLFHACSKTQMDTLSRLVNTVKSEKEKIMIKAYKSKLKSKFYQVYEENSQQFKEKIKYKIFHKCNYPSCGRTFASAGWLKSHFQEHLKEIKKNKFNILFENFLVNYHPRILNDICN